MVWCSHQGTRVCLPSSPIPTCHLHPPCHPLSLPSGQDPATPTPTPYTHQLYSASVLLCHSSAVHHNCCCCCCCCCCCSTSQSAKMGHPSLHTLLPQLCIAVMAALSVCGRLLGASPFQPFPTTGLPGRGGGETLCTTAPLARTRPRTLCCSYLLLIAMCVASRGSARRGRSECGPRHVNWTSGCPGECGPRPLHVQR